MTHTRMPSKVMNYVLFAWCSCRVFSLMGLRCIFRGVQGAGGGQGYSGSGVRRGSSGWVECSAAVSALVCDE